MNATERAQYHALDRETKLVEAKEIKKAALQPVDEELKTKASIAAVQDRIFAFFSVYAALEEARIRSLAESGGEFFVFAVAPMHKNMNEWVRCGTAEEIEGSREAYGHENIITIVSFLNGVSSVGK